MSSGFAGDQRVVTVYPVLIEQVRAEKQNERQNDKREDDDNESLHSIKAMRNFRIKRPLS